MANYLITDTELSAIADAIRAKTGGSTGLSPADMVTQIDEVYSAGKASVGATIMSAKAKPTMIRTKSSWATKTWNYPSGVTLGLQGRYMC